MQHYWTSRNCMKSPGYKKKLLSSNKELLKNFKRRAKKLQAHRWHHVLDGVILTYKAFMTSYQCYRWAVSVLTHNGSREAANCALCIPEERSQWGHDCLFIWGHAESSVVNHESSAKTLEPPRPVVQLITTHHFLHLDVTHMYIFICVMVTGNTHATWN